MVRQETKLQWLLGCQKNFQTGSSQLYEMKSYDGDWKVFLRLENFKCYWAGPKQSEKPWRQCCTLAILVFEEPFNLSSNITLTEELSKSHWLRNWNIFSVISLSFHTRKFKPAMRDRVFVDLPQIFWIRV